MKLTRPQLLTLVMLFWSAFILLCAPPRQAYADTARFTRTGGEWSATLNGSTLALPAGFGVSLSASGGAEVVYTVHSFDARPNSYTAQWVAGLIDGSLWCGWGGCSVGEFGMWNEGIGHASLGSAPVVGGVPLDGLVGEPVFITVTGPDIDIRIGSPPPVRRLDIVDFLAAWFAGDIAAGDWNRDGAVSVQDIFDFLAELAAR